MPQEEEEHPVIQEESNLETEAEAKLLTMSNQPSASKEPENPLATALGKSIVASSIHHLTPLLKNKDIDKVAQHFADNNGFEAYFKTSSLFGTNVKNVFDQAIFSTYDNRINKKNSPDDELDDMGPDKKATSTPEELNRQRSNKNQKKEKCVIQ